MTSLDYMPLTRDVKAALIPAGDHVILKKGEPAHIAQSLGGNYTVVVKGNLYRIDGKDADALGMTVAPELTQSQQVPRTREEIEQEVWKLLRTCYDPEIPVNIVDLGLVYDCRVSPLAGNLLYRVAIKMTLTAPGCGMGPILVQDVKNRVLSIEEVEEADVDLVWEPQWNHEMMTDEAKLKLGLL